MKHFILIAAMLSLTFTSPTLFADKYLGLGLYSSSIDAGGVDDSDITQAVFFGWKPVEMIGVEIGYYDLGSYEENATEFDADAVTLAGVATMPMGPTSAYLKIGVADTSAELKSAAQSVKDDSTENFFTLGANINVTSLIDIFAEIQSFTIDDEDIQMLGAGARIVF